MKDVDKMSSNELRAEVRVLRARNELLESIITRAYQRLGFTGHKNETMKILGEAIAAVQKDD